ncbi:helix-turn-helix domain-containing protein [Streptomyces sp. P9-2B-2]|uniref:helix-turn-helix domain-containing protein n=1 Tax=Streptomyces sp. P9-2B-2 TaxID=3057114 RepID=UPI0025B57F57|nr:helix-turn-helix domain-containing protein [Streptomyces sp. P9-2B-2]WJY39552.1 helix-turn-helix domain-containing protein [Streptomyces sp. P9-2B-2]
MAEEKPNAPARAQYVNRRSPSPHPAGVHQVTEFQDPGYTIVGNHLTQHRSLSGLAIGLAAYIQSLPEGAPVDIRTLAKRFPEGRGRIAAALRELEAHGYLERVRRRTDDGRMVTLTLSYNNPAATRARRARESAEQAKRRAAVAPPPAAPTNASRTPAPAPAPAPEPPRARTEPPCARVDPPHARPEPPPPPPEPRTRAHHTPAAALLANLRYEDPRLLLSVRDIHRLTPAVAAWLERGASPEAVRNALTTGLPPTLRHPAALLTHRLTELLPPPLPAASPAAPAPARARPAPLQTCDGCERAFRAPTPGCCRDCRHPARERGAA